MPLKNISKYEWLHKTSEVIYSNHNIIFFALMHVHACTHMHARTHARTHAHTHKHTYTEGM